jgi:enoyl-CoA hydratase/carnithine racemase
MRAADLAAAGANLIISEPGKHFEEARRFALRVAGFSPTAVRVSKRILDRIEWMELEEGYTFEQAATVKMSGHPDSKEALTAFREKRAAVYQTEIDRTMFD